MLENREVLDDGEAIDVAGAGVVAHLWVVLADIIVLAILLVHPGDPLEAAEGLVFLVVAPRDALVLEKIDDGGDVLVHLTEVIVLHAEVIAPDSGDVVRLRGMCDGMVATQGNPLLGKPGEICCNLSACIRRIRTYFWCKGSKHTVIDGHLVIGVLEPDDSKTIKRLALDLARGA